MINAMGVWFVVSHLLVTLAILVLYGYTYVIGKPDTTLQNLLLIIGGYWFGTMTFDKFQNLSGIFTKGSQTSTSPAAPVASSAPVPPPASAESAPQKPQVPGV